MTSQKILANDRTPGSGIGLATARHLHQKGWRISVVDLVESRGIEAAKSVEGIFSKVNITNYEELSASFHKTWEEFGRIDFGMFWWGMWLI